MILNKNYAFLWQLQNDIHLEEASAVRFNDHLKHEILQTKLIRSIGPI